MRVLISGASVAGPVAAYWLARYGFQVTVVERAATGHQAGGHAVDLFRPAMQVVQHMGVVDAVRAHATGIDSITAFKLGSDRPVEDVGADDGEAGAAADRGSGAVAGVADQRDTAARPRIHDDLADGLEVENVRLVEFLKPPVDAGSLRNVAVSMPVLSPPTRRPFTPTSQAVDV